MNKELYITIIITFLAMLLSCQPNDNTSKLNLDFEEIIDGIPAGWTHGGSTNYTISLDLVYVKSGKYAGFIGCEEGKAGFGSWTFVLPHNYKGKTITLSGYIKTENITDGSAGLWMRIDPEIAFDNMAQTGITGTTDWTEYKITLRMNSEETKQIVFGGLLRGKGKMWIDDLRVTIDGKDISKTKIVPRKICRAENDTAFDYNSTIIIPELDKRMIDNLDLLGKLWGFLKYHHPEIGKGSYNWDYELFRILPEYLKVTDKKQRNQLLLKWINKYGEIPVCKTCKKTSGDAFLKPDLTWIEKSGIDKDLKNKIKEIYQNRSQGKHHYIRMDLYDNSIFLNENSHSNMSFPDQGFRLLALYRYWNIIHYFFPYKYLTEKNWDMVIQEYIPKFLNVSNELEYELVVLQLIGEVNDTHANLWEGGNKIDSLRGDKYAPFCVRFIENKLVVTDYYNPELQEISGLQVGDIITRIEEKPVEKIVDSRSLPTLYFSYMYLRLGVRQHISNKSQRSFL